VCRCSSVRPTPVVLQTVRHPQGCSGGDLPGAAWYQPIEGDMARRRLPLASRSSDHSSSYVRCVRARVLPSSGEAPLR
jgi:hypothetical protein